MMMKEISLHILDIIQNSIVAKATLIEIELYVFHAEDRMGLSISDNGCGMTEEFQRQVLDPFVTTRTTRKVGLGIPMFQAGAEASGGTFSLQSAPGQGTRIEASYRISHWDRPPLGDIAETLYASVLHILWMIKISGRIRGKSKRAWGAFPSIRRRCPPGSENIYMKVLKH